MITSRPALLRLVALLALLLGTNTFSHAAGSESTLRQRFKSRLPAIEQLKQAGTIGEAFDGYLLAVNNQRLSDSAQQLIAAENADRKVLYQAIAARQKTTPAIVGQNNYLREYRSSPKGYWFQTQEGEWTRK